MVPSVALLMMCVYALFVAPCCSSQPGKLGSSLFGSWITKKLRCLEEAGWLTRARRWERRGLCEKDSQLKTCSCAARRELQGAEKIEDVRFNLSSSSPPSIHAPCPLPFPPHQSGPSSLSPAQKKKRALDTGLVAFHKLFPYYPKSLFP